jgi:drug/metabolite transporter (DMT)-like permease
MSIYLFLPLLSATLYGLSYAILGVALKQVTFVTFVFYQMMLNIIMASCLVMWKRADLKFLPLEFGEGGGGKILLFIVMASIAGWVAWMSSSYTMKTVNPTYAALGEIAYPIFVPLFAYLIFKDKQWDMATVVGGSIVMLGLFIMIYFKARA